MLKVQAKQNSSPHPKWSLDIFLSDLSAVIKQVIPFLLASLLFFNPTHARGWEHRSLIFENVPLMPGLKIIDKGDGRPDEVAVYRVLTEASVNLVADDIYDYYEYTLPKHHWEIIPNRRGAFINNAQELLIRPQTQNDVLTVIFTSIR